MAVEESQHAGRYLENFVVSRKSRHDEIKFRPMREKQKYPGASAQTLGVPPGGMGILRIAEKYWS